VEKEDTTDNNANEVLIKFQYASLREWTMAAEEAITKIDKTGFVLRVLTVNRLTTNLSCDGICSPVSALELAIGKAPSYQSADVP
jgi:hypothetical protein